MLANHIWSFVGDGDRADIGNTLVQPFGSFTTPTSWAYSVSSEIAFKWEGEGRAIPVNLVDESDDTLPGA